VHRQLVFRWELTDGELVARGDGAARLAPPDSARLDFFVAGGLGSGAAVLIGAETRFPGGEAFQRMIPSAPMLWAALGRLAVPALRDTVARMDGAVLRADIGTPVEWRVTFEEGHLRRVERVAGGRVQEWVERAPDGHVRYRDERDRRSLDLVITKTDEVPPFDPKIFTSP
jgi:hypothetical protein